MATQMRDAIRMRQIALFSMITEQDPFKRDAEIMKFYNYAGDYRRAHVGMLKLMPRGPSPISSPI